MELYERVKMLRKEHLHMTQTEFGERIGVSRSVVNNIERNVLARPEQKLSLMKLICSEFGICEKWLLEGDGPIFVQPDTFTLDDFVKSKGASDLELEILKIYFELDPEIRKAAMEHFKTRLLSAVAKDPALLVPDTPEELEKLCPPTDVRRKSS